MMRGSLTKKLAWASCTLAAFLCLVAGSNPSRAAERPDKWALDSFGPRGQCGASRQLDPNHPSQIAIGLNRDGSYLTLQNLQWRLPRTPTNTMQVKLAFDGSKSIKTNALLISQIQTFQIFTMLMPVSEEEFWKRLLSSKSLTISGPFRPGKISIDLKDAGEVVPILQACAKQYLPERNLPFPFEDPGQG